MIMAPGSRPQRAPGPPAPPNVVLEGVRLHAIDETQCVDHVLDSLAAGRGGWVVTPNLDHLRRLVRDDAFRERYGRADLAVADGMPLVWACRLQRTPLPGRVAGSDLIWSLTRGAARRGRSVYFLGGSPGTADAAARRLAELHPDLRVAGTSCPEVSLDRDARAVDAIAQELARARPDVVFVALGSPKQELLIDALRPRFPATWWLGVGISFSFVCGDVRRAPPWVRSMGLEWMHRFLQEPRRLARRYLVDGLPFAARLIARSAARGLRARVRSRHVTRVT